MPTVVAEPPLPKAGGGGGDVNRRGGRNEDIRRTAPFGRSGGVLSGTGARRRQTTWTEDHVQRNRRKQSDESCRATLIQSGGGGGVEVEVHGGGGGMFLARASGQHVIGNTDPGKAPVMLSAPRGDTLANKPKMHLAHMEVLDSIPIEEAECLEPLLISVPDTPLDSKSMAGNMMRNSSDCAVPQKEQTGRPMEGVTSTQLHLDRIGRNIRGRTIYQTGRRGLLAIRQCQGVVVQNKTPGRKVCFYGNQTVPYESKDNAVQTAPSALAEDPKSGSQSNPFILKPVPDVYAERRKSEERSPSESSCQTGRSLAQTDQPEYTGSRPESGKAIVVGAIGSAAPWFLTGWAHDVEIEFMIDIGCQVTILSTMVFQRMCVANPEVHSALQTSRRRLVSADSSPLMVQGQLDLDIVFPGLCCKMLFVVANIGSDGLLGTEALQSYLPHQLDLRTGQLWADGWSMLKLHQQRLTPDN